MPHEIAESDWKRFRPILERAVDRFFAAAVEELRACLADSSHSARQQFHATADLAGRRKKELADLVDGVRRSNCVVCIAALRYRGLITDDEFAQFSPALRDAIAAILS
jgi:hypothetical protein